MRTQNLTSSIALVAALIGAFCVVRAEDDPEVEDIGAARWAHMQEYFKVDQWPTNSPHVCGFEFSIGDYPALLEGWEIEENRAWPAMSGRHLYTTPQADRRSFGSMDDLLARDEANDKYAAGVVRLIKIRKTEADDALVIRICVAPDAATAANFMLLPILFMQSRYEPHYRSSQALEISLGGAAILRDCGPPDACSPQDTKSVVFMRHNVIVDISCQEFDPDGNPTPGNLNVYGLAQAMDGRIESQRVAAEGNPEKPTLSFSLSQPSIEHGSIPLAGVSEIVVTQSATLASGTPEKFFFMATRAQQYSMIAGELVEGEWAYQIGAPFSFDDWENPTKLQLRGGGASPPGDYHIGMIAWGPNLLPVVAFAPLQITEPQE